ncbi:amylo-alpha-1,6-glucosidase [Leptolyngbya sp. BC1307]|uniref:amylo-alpha-1,6-glucosidase n=1 Tax=Leptolyngbya sp. BC1307 TaxID=2029589 RepID=UPI000EFD9124|nr:amylo-alpha-1,6-glucosidase [Leptolyngbya sp. BC1307]
MASRDQLNVVDFGRAICSSLPQAEQREWLIANGIGGYGCGTLAGTLTRCYHGLLVAALKPPLGRTLLLTKLDETVSYQRMSYPLSCDRWAGGTLTGHGYLQLERFHLEGTIPVWHYAIADALLEKRIWMQPGENTTYIQYQLCRATGPLTLSIKALINYRDHHSVTQSKDWDEQPVQTKPHPKGLQIQAFEEATPFYLLSDKGQLLPASKWYQHYLLTVDHYRGLVHLDDNLHAATLRTTLRPGETLTIVASTHPQPSLDGQTALSTRQQYEQNLLTQALPAPSLPHSPAPPPWIQQLTLAADQFIVDRTIPGNDTPGNDTPGKTIIAGYPWFGDWGRDTMIALPGLTLATQRPEIARPILRTFARYLSQGMLPNAFPEANDTPGYNTVDAILWYFEAIRAYIAATQDDDLLQELFPALAEVIDWHVRGTRYQIHLDSDGLIYAGQPGEQLTWMDAKVDDWVVTPRIGKPVEINALWHNALMAMAQFCRRLNKPDSEYMALAQRAATSFEKFWQTDAGYCYDVIDGPEGNDAALRPNQVFAVSLALAPPLTAQQQKAIVDTSAQQLLTSHGMRSLNPTHPDYIGRYGGDRYKRDGAYHQGTVWSWLIGPFVQAHLKVYQDPAAARSLLMPLAHHLRTGCVGTLSEIFDGDPPYLPRGAYAQAWSVAEVLRLWQLIDQWPPT